MTVNIPNQKTNLLIETIKSIGFFSRLLSWKSVKSLSLEAASEYKILLSEVDRLVSLSKKSETLIQEVSEKKLEIEDLKLRLQSKEKESIRLDEINKNLQDKINDLNFKVANLTGTININSKEIEEKQSLVAQLEESKNYLNQQVLEFKSEITLKDGELNHFNKIITSKEAEIATLNVQNNNTNTKLFELKEELETLKAKNLVLSNQISEFNSDKVRFEEDIKNKIENILNLEKDISTKEEINKNLLKEYQSVKNDLTRANENIENNTNKITELKTIKLSNEQELKYLEEGIRTGSNEIATLKESIKQSEKRIKELETEKAIINTTYDSITLENQRLKREIASWEENQIKREQEHIYKVEKLQMLIEQVEKDKEKIKLDKEKEIIEKFEKMKRAWQNHEENVKKAILEICRRHDIDYVEEKQIPFKGKPDNTINIAGEYIIFDAKCPMNEDLENFPKYIQNQAELLKKYAKEERVKKDMFLIVPSNTISTDDTDKKSLKTFYYNMTDYRVFVIAIDSLEPVILSLKKVEEYEFAEKLSPEDRDNICRIIAKFAHTAKRKIQIDSFLNQRLAEVLIECSVLPEEFRDKVVKLETSDKLNPPQDRRNKNNSQKEIEKEIKLIGNIANIAEVNLESNVIEEINKIPLYK
ncbi:MAG: hypothetical protein U0354_15540 [Candidatus Sericytochromatia bacterium]